MFYMPRKGANFPLFAENGKKISDIMCLCVCELGGGTAFLLDA